MRAIIFDTETSGLVENRTRPLERQPEIIEFYACLVNLKTGKIKKELHLLIKPKVPLTEENIARHNITNEMLEGHPGFSSVAQEIMRFMKLSNLAIAHNARFDKDMIEIEMERLGVHMTMPKLLCTIEQTMHIKGHRMDLSSLYEYLFGEKFKDAHRARSDVMALFKCCIELHKREMI